jgi:Rieske Fe-S protein
MSRPERERLEPWREEFPIREDEERYVTRRQFARFLVLTSLGMFVGNLWILAKAWLRRAGRELPEVAVARVSELPVGGSAVFEYPEPGEPCLLIRSGENDFVAFSQKCTHLSCAVYWSKERDRIECPCHRGFFSARDGSVLEGPPPRPLPRVQLERRGDEIFAVGMAAGPEA